MYKINANPDADSYWVEEKGEHVADGGAPRRRNWSKTFQRRSWTLVAKGLSKEEYKRIVTGSKTLNGTVMAFLYNRCTQHEDCEHLFRIHLDKETGTYVVEETGTHTDVPVEPAQAPKRWNLIADNLTKEQFEERVTGLRIGTGSDPSYKVRT